MKRTAFASTLLLLLPLFPTLVHAVEKEREEDKRTDMQRRRENLAIARLFLGRIHACKSEWSKVARVLNAYEHEYAGFPERVFDALCLRARAFAETDKPDGLVYTVRYINRLLDRTPPEERGKHWARRRLEMDFMARAYFTRKAEKAAERGLQVERRRFERKAAEYMDGPWKPYSPKDLETRFRDVLDILLERGDLDAARRLLDMMDANRKYMGPLFPEYAFYLYDDLGDADHAQGMVHTARIMWEKSLRCKARMLGGSRPGRRSWWVHKINEYRVRMKLGEYRIVFESIKNLLRLFGEHPHPEDLEKIMEEARKRMS